MAGNRSRKAGQRSPSASVANSRPASDDWRGGGFQGGGFRASSHADDWRGSGFRAATPGTPLLAAAAGPEPAAALPAAPSFADWRGDDDWRGSGCRVAGNSDQFLAARQRGLPAVRLGWHADLPDHRDHSPDVEAIVRPLQQRKLSLMVAKSGLKAVVDNRQYCSPIEDQGELGSCTAQAAVGIMEYEMRRNGVPHVDGSRLFVYKTSRKLLGWTGDTGAYLRTAIKAIATFGIPPEEHWPYDPDRFEVEPDPFLYAYAQNFKALKYVRLDPYDTDSKTTLENVKRTLAAGFAAVFGFTVFDNLGSGPAIEFPDPKKHKTVGGHAVMAVGYNDNVQIGSGKFATKGALLIRNSWGSGWGEAGYGLLPYRYVLDELAVDFWTVFNTSWIDEGHFADI